MSWLTGLPDSGDDWQQLEQQYPEVVEALAGHVVAASSENDPVLFELARLRIATLLRNPAEPPGRIEALAAAGLTASMVAELSTWTSSSAFSDRERACLALAEQFVVDANGVTDELVAAVTEHLGPAGCYAFVEGVSVLETFQRACVTLGLRSVPSVDALAAAAVDRSTAPREVVS